MGVTLFIRSADGTLVPQFFGVRLESLTELTNVNGTGTLGNERVGTAKWILIPTNDAAPLEPLQYFVGGTLSYRADGLDVAIPLADVPITVLPNPRLTLKYFHQRDVFSDDPFTPLVEPAIPYSLGIMVINNGAGFAHNFRVTSGQPTIIENEKGLLADFRIIATQVNGQPLQPSLTANFGDIGPGAIAIGEWLFTSSIQGLFIDYSATFEHLDALDGVRLSLIEATEIYEMIHKVRALGALDDGAPDFLVNQVDDPRDLPDTIHLSDGTTAPVAVVEAAQVSGATVKTLTATLPVGWAYLRIPDPGNGQLRLRSVTRSDGLVLPLDVNAWTTDRTFLGQGQRPIYENILHLLDHDSTGSYTLDYEPLLPGDVLAPVSQVQPLGADSPREFAVTWTGTDDRGIAHFDIYVSIDGGAYSLWQERTRESGALFNGETGRTYAFYSRATDFAGNTEAAPTLAVGLRT